MLLKSVRLQNFKCFLDSTTVKFGKNWTVIVGQNNSGKSSFLSTLKLGGFPSAPYRGVSIDFDLPANQNSNLEFEIQINGQELKRCLLNTGQSFFWSQNDFGHVHPQNLQGIIEPLFQSMLDGHGLCLEGTVSTTQGHIAFRLNTTDGIPIFPGPASVRFEPNIERNGFQFAGVNHGAGDGQVAAWFGQLVGQSFYKFDAERMHIGISPIDNVTHLQENGSNLAQVLLKLKENDQKFSEFLNCVRTVLPNITGVVPTVYAQNQVGVEIQFHDPSINRQDLNFSLKECGTGTSQVLCILYVVVTSKHSKILIIDEPNSFLHPGAAKKLIEILSRYNQHQFVISTHSPELINSADPEQLLIVKWSTTGSQISEIDQNNVESMRFALGELGVNLSDLFGLDAVLWVEGPTEATCFPLLLEAVGKRLLPGTEFVPLRATGDITGKQKEAFFEIYSSITDINSVLPTAIVFSLDSENLSDQQKSDLADASKGLVQFLPRTTFENYLLHPQAICELMKELGENIKVDKVAEYISNQREDQEHIVWVKEVNGAKLFQKIFFEFTEGRHIYRKVEFAAKLIDWLIENDPKHLEELVAYVVGISKTTAK
jgi:ABC-type molybdenum transport system ATPase subunit/photorepair protein PhrA